MISIFSKAIILFTKGVERAEGTFSGGMFWGENVDCRIIDVILLLYEAKSGLLDINPRI